MSNKLVSRLLSFTLSATVALTSGVPALAYDGGGGDLLGEDEEIQLLDEEEVESDSDVEEEAPEFEEEEIEIFDEAETDEEAFEEEEDSAEFEAYAEADQARSLAIVGNATTANTETVESETRYKHFAYGSTSFAGLTFEVQDTNDSGTGPYSKVKWTIYKETTHTGTKADGSDHGGGGTDPNTAVGNLTEVAPSSFADYGLNVVIDGATLKINNAGPKKYANDWYYLVASDTEGTQKAYVQVQIAIDAAAISVTRSVSNFDSAKLGYTIVDYDEDAPGTSDNYVREIKLTLSSSTLLESFAVDDFKYEWDSGDTSAFATISESDDNQKPVYLNSNREIIVRPVEDLDNLGGTNGTYTATLKITSAALAPAGLTETFNFTVGNNLSISSVVGHDTAATPAESWVDVTSAISNPSLWGVYQTDDNLAPSGSNNPVISTDTVLVADYDGEGEGTDARKYWMKQYNLGTFGVGENIDDVIIAATGGSGDIEFKEFTTGTTYAMIGDSTSPLIAGLQGVKDERSNLSTYEIQGGANENTLQPYSFGLIAEDALENHSAGALFTYTLAAAKDIAIYIDEDSPFIYGSVDGTTNVYEWYAATGYAQKDVTKQIVIKNNSKSSITLSASAMFTDADCAEGHAFNHTTGNYEAPVDSSLTIAAGGKATVTVKPKTGIAAADAYLKISGAKISPTVVRMKFDASTTDITITGAASPLPNAEVGKEYKYQFNATKVSAITSVAWNVASFTPPGGTAVAAPNAAKELAKYGLKLDETTGILSGTPTKTAAGMSITVEAYNTANNAQNDTETVNLSIVASPAAFEFSYNGSAVDMTDVLEMGEVRSDAIGDAEVTVTIKNDTAVDLKGVKVVVDSVDSTTSGDNAGMAILVFSDNDAINNSMKYAFDLDAGESKNFVLKINPAIATTSNNEHYVILKATDATATSTPNGYTLPDGYTSLAGAKQMKATFSVVAQPTITLAYGDSGTYSVTALKEIKASDKVKYKVYDYGTTTPDVAANYKFAWTEGTVPGLTLSEDGVITGTPSEAGEFDVTVTATKKKDPTVVGTLKQTIIVHGSSTFSLALVASPNLTITDKSAVLLAGMVEGEETGTKATVNLSVSSTDNAAQGLNIKVEDSEDDRGASEAADVEEHPENPYEGSSNYIGVSQTSWGTIASGANQSFTIVSKGSPAPGIYKVKITVSGTNTNTIVFYAVMVVAKKFAITQPNNANTYIGYDFTTKPITIETTGAMDTQIIKWAEVGTKVDTATKYYVTPSGNPGSANTNTGLTMRDSSTNVIGTKVTAPAIGWDKTTITGQLLTAGTSSVTIKASVDAAKYNSAGTMKSDVVLKRSGTIVNPNQVGVYPKQEAEAVSFNIISAKSEKVTIKNVTAGTGVGEVIGLKSGDVYVTRTGFEYSSSIEGYNKSQKEVTVTIENKIFSSGTRKAVAKAAFSENSNFEVTSAKSIEVVNGSTGYFKIAPVAGLKKGTYTDKLQISGDTFETIEFDVSFVVEDNTYLVSVDNGKTDDKKVVYVEKNEVKGIAVELDSYIAGEAATAKELVVTNSGNASINNVSAYEVKADGSKYPSGSSDIMLNVTTLSSKVMASKATQTLKFTPVKKSAGVYNTYIDLHFEEGTGTSAVKHDVLIPVKYVVIGSALETLAVSPESDTTIEVEEGYTPANYATEFVLKNNGTEETDTISTIKVRATIGGTYVKIKPETDTKTLEAGKSVVYTVLPAAGLSEGTYDATITISGANINAPIKRAIKIKVKASTTYTARTDSAGNDAFVTVTSSSFAGRLYNSLVGLAERKTNKSPKVTFIDEDTVTVDFDNSGNDIEVQFDGSGSASPTGLSGTYLTSVTGFAIKTLSTNTVSEAKKAIVLSDEAVGLAKKAVGAATNVDAKYFSIVNVEFYEIVTFGVDKSGGTPATVYAEKKGDLDSDFVIVNDNYKDDGTTATADEYADGEIKAYIPYGSTLGSAFGGKLPTAVETGRVMTSWNSASGAVTANKVITTNYLGLTPVFHTHEYALSNVTDEKFVKWVWTKDAKGNLSAELHLFCIEDGCPGYEDSEIVIDGTAKTAKYGSLEYKGREGTDATCEKAAGYTYTVVATVDQNAIGTGSDRNYTGTYVEEKSGEPLGHKYDMSNPAKIVWTDTNKDKKIDADELTITRVCTRDETHVATLKVVSVARDPEKSKAPTCTQPGYDVIAITYEEIDEKGDAAGNVTVIYNDGEKFVVPATGHSEEVDVIVTDFNKETKKATVTIKCKNENCDAADHIVFGPAEVTFTDAGSETYTAELTLTDGTKRTISYVNDVFYNATVNWTKKFETKYTKGTGLPAIEYTITYTSKNSGKSVTTDAIAATVTADKDYSAESTEKEITFTATADLSGYYKDKEATTAATAAPLTITYKFKNGGLYGTSGQEIGGDMIVEGLEDEYFYTGAPIKPTMVVTDGDMVLAEGVDYSVEYKNNKKISSKTGDEYTKTAQVTVKGKGNYAGQGQTLYFAIIDPKDEVKEDDMALKGYSIKLPKEDHIYTGEAQYPSYIIIKKGKTELTYEHQGDGAYANTEGEIPAVVTFSNNVNKGAATVCLTGTDKSIKKTFQIKAATFNGDFEVSVDESVAWAVKGAQPTVGIAWNGAELVPGQDFKVSYSKNKAIGTATAKITGKGNFKGKLEKSFSVVALPLTEANVAGATAVDGKKISNVVVLDNEGNTINKKNYTVTVLDETGADVTKAKLAAGKEYTLVIKAAKDVVATDEDGVSVTVKAGYNLAKAKVDAKSVSKTYTGEAIELDADDMAKIKVTYSGKALEFGTDYEIAGYTNNIKKGNMKVTIRGIGEFSGSKTFKVKIAPKPIAATN